MYSHGGVRTAGEVATSERALLSTQARRIADLGGVFGLGTEGNIAPKTLAVPQTGFRFAGSSRSFEVNLEQPWTDHFQLVVTNAANGLDSTESAFAQIELAGRAPIEVPLNSGGVWAGGSTQTVTIPLSSPAPATDLVRLTLRLNGGPNAAWEIRSLRLDAVTARGGRRTMVFETVISPTTGFFERLASPSALTWSKQLWFAPETAVRRAVVRIRNGTTSSLPGASTPYFFGGGAATGTLFLADRRGLDQNLSAGATWELGSTQERTFDLPAGTRAGDVQRLMLRFAPPDGLGGMWWEVAQVTVLLEATSGERVTVANVTPGWRFDAKNNLGFVELKPPELAPLDAPAAGLRINLDIVDEMDSMGIDINATVRTTSGTTVVASINEAGRLRNEGTTRVMIPLPAGTRVRDLDRLRIESPGTDDWEFSRIVVDALADPVPTWSREYVHTLEVMGGRGVALGTDLNGLAPQVPFTRVDVPERIDVASTRAPAHLAGTAPALLTSALGDVTFRFEDRGSAHYGMLPDFLQAVAAQPEGEAVMNGLFRSAEDFLAMWDRVLAAQELVRRMPDATPVQRLRVTVVTGGDDLRCDSSARAFVTLRSGAETTVELGSAFSEGEVVTQEFSLPEPTTLGELQWFGVRASLSGGNLFGCESFTTQDNWDVNSARLEFLNPSGQWETLMFRRGRPLKRMDHGPGNQEWRDLL